MTNLLTRDIQTLDAALEGSVGDVEVTLRLPRDAAKKVRDLLDGERTTGVVVMKVKKEFTTSEAATLLEMSRPTLMRHIQRGEIQARMVGSHHRVPATEVARFAADRAEQEAEAGRVMAEFSNSVGFLD